MLRDQFFVRFLIASLAIAFVYMQSTSTFALHVRDSGLSNAMYGALVSLNGVLIIFLELPVTAITQRLRARPVIAAGMLVVGLGFGLTALAHTAPALVLTVMVWTLGEILGAPVASAYVADIALPRMAHLAVIRSSHGHAVLGSIDASRSLSMPGVVGVFGAADLSGRVWPLPANVVEGATVAPATHPPLATGRVRYAGEPVAVVVAETMEAALDAAAEVEVGYEPLPAVVDPQDALRAGIGYLPPDRRTLGLFLRMPVKDNIVVTALNQITRSGIIDDGHATTIAARYVDRLQIHSPSVSQVVGRLSGGNQQKVALSKWLLRRPRVLIVDGPTIGVDVGARVAIHQLLYQLAADGMSILLLSTDLPELLGLSNYIIVMNGGRVAGTLSGDEASERRVMTLAAGQPAQLDPADA